ncbi:MAG: TIGR04211 family SH3 domain-containing protein [Deferrisomatales bacterium]|nr:TIGR04211 family SH3 domain-containing protein [Deferrisomatales bacterium]
MSVPTRCWVLVFAILWWAVPPAHAETRYVSDVLVINLRDAPASGAATIALLRTGESFEVLDTQGTYLRVRTPAGEEGWVTQQYTTAETPKAHVVASLRQELAQVKKQAAEAEDERARLQAELRQIEESRGAAAKSAAQELSTARKEAQDSARQYQQVSEKYEALLSQSTQVLEITAERDALRDKSAQLEAQVRQLDGELASVTRSSLVTGLAVGRGLVLVGWVLGSTSRKKKSRFSVG